MWKLTNNQKGNVTLITLIMFSMAGVMMLLPMMQGAFVTFNNTRQETERIKSSVLAASALHYVTKTFLMNSSRTHTNTTYTLTDFNEPVYVDVNVTPHQDNTPDGEVILTASVPMNDGNYLKKTVHYKYVDLSRYAVYTKGTTTNLVAGKFVHVVSGGRQSWYVEEDDLKKRENATAFPIIKKDNAWYYSGDQQLERWNFEKYRIVNNGRWIIPFKFGGGRQNLSQILQADGGYAVNMDPVPTLPKVMWVDFFCERVLKENIYRDDYWGSNFFIHEDDGSGNPMVFEMNEPWDLQLRYYPQVNNDINRPRFARNWIIDDFQMNFGVLYGTILSETDVVVNQPFSTYIPVSGNPRHWMRGQKGYWALVEQTGLWFCISDDYANRMTDIARDYTLNQGPCLLTERIRD